MALPSYDLDYILGLEKADFTAFIDAAEKADIVKIEKVLAEYVAKYKPLGDPEKSRWKLGEVTRAKSGKKEKLLRTVIVKAQKETASTPEAPKKATKTSAPKAASVSAPAKSSGFSAGLMNHINPSAAIKAPIVVPAPAIQKVEVVNVQTLAKTIEKLEDTVDAAATGKVSKVRRKRKTKFELENQAIKRLDAENRGTHIKEIVRHHKSVAKLTLEKLKTDLEKESQKTERLKITSSASQTIELTKKAKMEIAAQNKLDVLNTKANIDAMKKREMNAAAVEKISANAEARAKVIKEKAAAYKEIMAEKRKLKDAAYEKSHKLAMERQENLRKTRLEMSKKRQQDIGKNQMERHLHAIHPALGLLYGISKNVEKKQEKTEDGNGLSSAAIGGIAGMVGGNAGSFGRNALKFAFKGAGLPIIGALAAGVIEAAESGDWMKGGATSAGALGGTAIGAAIGSVLLPGIGTYIGGLLGGWLGSLSAKQFYNFMNGNTEESPSQGFGRFASRNAMTAPANVANSSSGGSSSQFIQKAEGFSANAYWDGSANGAKKVSIGYGHQITDKELSQGYIEAGGERIPISGQSGIGTKITKAQADALYKKDNGKYEDIARRGIGDALFNSLNENEKAALTSYAYNTGSVNSLVKKGLKQKLSAGDKQGAAQLISSGIATSDGVFNQGVYNRRQQEAKLFLDKSPSLVSKLKSAEDVQRANAMAKSAQPTPVVISNNGGGSSNVTNITNVVHAPNFDSTLREQANRVQHTARPL
jgi:GH24 family phage-related lysozyme (muramidase)